MFNMNLFNNSNGLNGATVSIMQSRQNLSTVYPYYQKLRQSYSAATARKFALDYFNLTEADFTDVDLKELN